jgi:hypothetical protein
VVLIAAVVPEVLVKKDFKNNGMEILICGI